MGLLGTIGQAAKIAGELKDLPGEIRAAITGEMTPADRAQLEMISAKAQAAVNEAEARHPSLFVAGARPAILWICGLALLYHYILWPLLSWLTTEPIPRVEMQELYPILMGILGLGGYRTYEKYKGVEHRHG